MNGTLCFIRPETKWTSRLRRHSFATITGAFAFFAAASAALSCGRLLSSSLPVWVSMKVAAMVKPSASAKRAPWRAEDPHSRRIWKRRVHGRVSRRHGCRARPKVPEIKASKGTVEWAWLLYMQSASWAAKALATRRQRENIMRHVIASAGREAISDIDTQAIRDGIDRHGKTPSQAKNFRQTMNQFFEWLVEAKIVAVNPVLAAKLPKGNKKTGGVKRWTVEDIVKYEERWPIGTRERVMLDVYMYTGLRRAMPRSSASSMSKTASSAGRCGLRRSH
jgi:hypothetical protein